MQTSLPSTPSTFIYSVPQPNLKAKEDLGITYCILLKAVIFAANDNNYK
jgi:hypothetical protein